MSMHKLQAWSEVGHGTHSGARMETSSPILFSQRPSRRIGVQPEGLGKNVHLRDFPRSTAMIEILA